MKKKYTIALAALAIIAAGGTLAGISGNSYVSAIPVPWHANDTAALFYQSMVQRSNNPNQVLNDLAAQQAQRDGWDKLSPQEKQRQYDQSIAKFKADMAARATAQPQAAGQVAAPSTGLNNQMDALMPSASFNQLQPGWWGSPNGVDTVVVSGNSTSDYNQGVVVVQTRGGSTTMESFKTPTATGPVKIVSYSGNVITLQSQAGKWDVYNVNTDTHSSLTTNGGVTYKFDVVKRAFVQ